MSPDIICRGKASGLANSALWEPWTKPHFLAPHLLGPATPWCSQRQKVEGNDSVLTAMKSSLDGMSARVGYRSPKGGTSEEGRWRDDVTNRGHRWSTIRNLKYFSKHSIEVCMKAKNIKKGHCVAQRGLTAKWLIKHPCKTTEKATSFKASRSTSLCRKHSQMQRLDDRSKSQPDEQHWG